MASATVDTTERRPKPSNDRIGDYELIQRLGAGGMANVYKVRDESGRIFALKELRPQGGAKGEMTRRFRTEFEITRRLDHENIVVVHDFFPADHTFHIVMEYVDGLDLRELSKRFDSLPVGILAMLGAEIAAGLRHAHEMQVLHRDMKPENVLLSREGQVKVADFGVARLAGTRLTTTGIIVGSPAYMSPEQLAGVNGQDLTATTDIYALGVMLYELGEGKDPLGLKRSQDLLTVLRMKREKKPRKMTRLADPDLCALLLRCLASKDTDRPESMAEVEAVLRRVARNHGVRVGDLRGLVAHALDPAVAKAASGRRSDRTPSPAGLARPQLLPATSVHGAVGPSPYHPPPPVADDFDRAPEPARARLHSAELRAPVQDGADPDGLREVAPRRGGRARDWSLKKRSVDPDPNRPIAWLAIGLFVLAVIFLGVSSALTGSPLGLVEALVPSP